MTVRRRVGRIRYIGFVVNSAEGVGRSELEASLGELSRVLPPLEGRRGRIELTVFNGKKGILRVPHRWRNSVVELLPRITMKRFGGTALELRPVVTSGTISKVKRRLGFAARRPPARAVKGPPF
ncbi:MAG: hypothetical protein QXH42_05650 [Thermoplasmata archaeon]